MRIFYDGNSKQTFLKNFARFVYGFALVLILLFSSMLFSACGDNYKNIGFVFYSSSGEIVEELNFVIDPTLASSAQRVGVELTGIDKEDVGQIKIYSVPNELIVDSNYYYKDNMCYVDITPVMPTSNSQEAKLVVSHLASGKKGEIGLNIEQKSSSLEVTNSKYIVSIPAENEISHSVDFSKLVNLLPIGSTDDIYFKFVNSLPDGVDAISVENESLEDVFSGFKVASDTTDSTDDTCVKIYPVTYLDGYEAKEYTNKIISIYFKHTITADNLEVEPKEEVEVVLNDLQLVANDTAFNSFNVSLKYNEEILFGSERTDGLNFFDMYEIEAISTDAQNILTLVESNNDVVVIANAYTEDFVEIKIILKPINYVGDITRVEKSIFVKGELKSDNITIRKNGEIILTSEKINIFDYYEEGNSLGALFKFEPITNSGLEVHQDLNKMQIVISPDILCEENCLGDKPENLNSKLYSLMFHHFNDYLEFTYDSNTGKMVSEEITKDSQIYIKYVKGAGTIESADFGISVKTLNHSTLANWENLQPTTIELDFNRLEGVKSMVLEAGEVDAVASGTLTPKGFNPEYIYLNRLSGLDNDDVSVIYISAQNNQVLSVEGMPIPKVDFSVEVEALSDVNNPLTICNGIATKDSVTVQKGENKIIYSYDHAINDDIISLIFRKDTDIGDYKITFYQEGVEKSSVICRVYEDLTVIKDEYVSFETSNTAFENNYTDIYTDADYIVASGQKLNVSIDLPQVILDSEIVNGYSFSFDVGVKQEDGTILSVGNVKDYFDYAHDDPSFNYVLLDFIQGTYIEDKPQYVYFNVTVKTKVFSDIVTISSDEREISYPICFYIYEEITREKISINHTHMTRYFEEYLGVYYKDEANAELKIEMDDNLWNYVTNIIDPDTFASKKVDWRLDDEAGKIISSANDETYRITFGKIADQSTYVRTVKAYVYQFDNIFEFQCVFNVEKPTISQRLTIQSEINIRDDENQSYYINLKEGETYKIDALNYSSLGEVTHDDIIIQVFDESGSAYSARNYFDVDQTNNQITVKEVDALHKFKLVVFAKDALQYIPSQDKSGYNIPSSFLMDFTGPEQGLYNKAYFVMDIELSDGSEENPYLITNANEFWEIDDNELFKQAHYKLMTSLNVNSTTDINKKTISGFIGSIVTDNNNIYTIDGITLSAVNKTLFSGFVGEISNIKFVVNYAYSFETDPTVGTLEEDYVGLFDKNNGTLVDVSVEITGNAKFNINRTTYYFGSLVGENLGTIQYTKSAGVRGNIVLSGSSKLFYGGLVGKNVGSIFGCEETVTASGDRVVLNTSTGRENVLSQVEINAEVLGSGSSIGGVVGLNTYSDSTTGVIHNAFVQATINAANISNVGGVIGSNKQNTNSLTLYGNEYISSIDDVFVSEEIEDIIVRKYIDIAIYNVKSASVITAKDSVGGIVGTDKNGLYIECDYQILSSSTKTSISANNNVGGIAGSSENGKFAYCSVMSYWWNYAGLQSNVSTVITDLADISGNDYVGGIVGYAISDTSLVSLSISGTATNGRLIIAYSSVNAYLQATKLETNNIGGILATDATKSYISIVFNAYFIGKLDGIVNYETQLGSQYLCVDNNNSTYYNFVYTLNIDNTNLISGCLGIDNTFNIKGDTGEDYWWYNQNINGGYAFITIDKDANDNSVPIFDLSPDSISVSVKDETNDDLKKVLRLEYYDFSQNTSLTDVQLTTLNDDYNRNKAVLDLLAFEILPTSLGTVVLNVRSTNSNIIDVSLDGRLLINGVGECELIFSSVLNPNAGAVADRTIKVIVDYPIGDNFNISTSKTDISKIVNGTQNIAKGSSKLYYVITSGLVEEYDFNADGIKESYAYKTKDNVHLKIDITHEDGANISDYISVSGQTGVQIGNVYTVNLDNKTPLSLSVLDKLENLNNKQYSLVVEITPYAVINNGIKDIIISYSTQTTFNLSTMAGATSVSFSYDEAIVYPNDTVYLTAHIQTDLPICLNGANIDIAELQELLNANPINLGNILLNAIKSNNVISFKIYADSSEYNATIQVQTIVFRIEFDEMSLSNEAKLTLQAEYNDDVLDSVNYTIIPQRINKIEIKNYYYKNTGTIDVPVYVQVLDDVLKPNFPGKLQLDIVPNNGYYDYLEISDITGEEEILFIQVDKDGNALSLQYDPSSDGKGIKLYANVGSTIYVRTQIDKNYSSRIHTIEVRAYSSNETLLYRQTKEIDVKMLPEITVDYLVPDGTAYATVNSSEIATRSDLLLANGVDANFRITTENANGELESSLSGDLATKYEFVQDVGNHYVLKRKGNATIDTADIGKKVQISWKTYAYLDNGDFEVAECSVTFTIVSFVIHDVSVNSSIENSEKTEIYGYFNKEIKLNFYFDKDDISFYDTTTENEPYWDTVYEYTAGIEKDYDAGSALFEIYSILKELNGYDASYIVKDTNDYLMLNDDQKSDGKYTYAGTPTSISIINNKLFVTEDNYDPKYLAVAFRIYYKDGWKCETYDGTTEADQAYIINKNYNLNFREATKWYEPEVVTTAEEFNEMTSGGRYILANDLTGENALTNYVPIDADLVEFDGNGHTIEIKSFGLFNEEDIQAGLFKQIYPNMIVKNVIVTYESENNNGNWTFGNLNSSGIEYTDMCNNPDINYTSINFGGITAVNNGIITNCVVKGQIAINASTVEQKKFASEGNYAINFFVGGMVAENSATGYITNSTSKLSIIAQANIGGFAYSNAGKIVSCGVESNSDTTIYAYNTNLDKTIVVEVAGFVVENTKEISMSFVDFESQSETLVSSVLKGTMSAKDISAGFAYSNNGLITDTYVYMANTGVNNNTFSGFVNTNAGTITRAYTYINKGVKVDNNDSMFAPAGTIGLVNCIELIVKKTGYSNGIVQGLNAVDASLRYTNSTYEDQGFAFGDNESAVWSIVSGLHPKLVSTQEKVENPDGLLKIASSNEIVNGIEQTTYNVSYANYGTKENPYIIYDVKDTSSEELSSWTNFFVKDINETKSYYRIVKDIDFGVVGDNPITSTKTFKGNIQGNNMTLSNIMLYSTSSLEALGLFKNMESANDNEITNAVRNLKLTTTSVWASKTSSVGLLAGVIEDFNIYNITIDAQGVIMVGGNAVGGVAGVVRGELDMDQISTNIGANSTRASTLYNYSIYNSKNNKKSASENLSTVYYAGSVAGILDGYNRSLYDINAKRDLADKYYKVRNVYVNGAVTIIGDTVGGAFGFVGERVYVTRANVNISGSLAGAQYSAGIAGENRGVIDNSNIPTIIADNAFNQSTNVSSGIVGFNLGGLIRNVDAQVNIKKTGYGKIVAGVVGRNIYGTINNAHFEGELSAYFTGGIVGASYTSTMFINASSGSGTLTVECRTNNTYLIPKNKVLYYENGEKLNDYENISFSKETLEHMLNTSTEFYSYQNVNEPEPTLNMITTKLKVFGVIVGLGYEKLDEDLKISFDANGNIAFNTTDEEQTNVIKSGKLQESDNKGIILKQGSSESENVRHLFESARTVYYEIEISKVMYMTGAVVSAYDTWYNSYSDDYVVFTTTSPIEITS